MSKNTATVKPLRLGPATIAGFNRQRNRDGKINPRVDRARTQRERLARAKARKSL